MSNLKKRGFSTLEFLIVLGIIAILASLGFPAIRKLYRTYKFNSYAFELESLVKWAKITAVERSIGVSICKKDNSIVVYNEDTSRNPSCSGEVLKTLVISDSWVTSDIDVALGKSGLMFDPRGLVIFGGNVCITDGENYFKVKLQSNKSAIITEAGSGGC